MTAAWVAMLVSIAVVVAFAANVPPVMNVLLWGIHQSDCDDRSFFVSPSFSAVANFHCNKHLGHACGTSAIVNAISLIDASAPWPVNCSDNGDGRMSGAMRFLRMSCARGGHYLPLGFDVLDLFANAPLDLRNDLPLEVRTTRWDAVFVGEHACGSQPRDYIKSLYTVRLLAVRYDEQVDSATSTVVVVSPREIDHLQTVRRVIFDANKTLALSSSSSDVAYILSPEWSPAGDGFPRKNTAILLTITSGFIDIFYNWFFYFQRLNMGIRTVVVSCWDEAAFVELRSTVRDPRFHIRASWNYSDSNSTLVWGSTAYKRLVSSRQAQVLELFDKGFEAVVMSDIDLIYLHDPLLYVLNSAVSDVWASLDYYGPNFGRPGILNYNAGFMVFRRSPSSISMLKTWCDELTKGNLTISDQPMLKSLVKAGKVVKFGILPHAQFPPGLLYFVERGGEAINRRLLAAVAHVTWTTEHGEKIARLREQSHWLLAK